ncbi:plexin-B2-like [Melanaphis sacchari]|uniref:plexin-B2-like n=1 Tax=Melanaphis sacchari TaxID=742174 RepID=UPI000DC13C9E|nr:plexin-B2-like [Melanaphis sacchari]
MVDRRHQRKYYGNSFIHIILIAMIFVTVSHANDSSKMEKNAMVCAEFLTCQKCARHVFCSWSLDLQKCLVTPPTLGNLTVNIEAHCPQFSVPKKSVLRDELFSYTVVVSNDQNNFVKFLQDRTITCHLDEEKLPGYVLNDEIKCDTKRLAAQRNKRFKALMIYHYYITIDDGIILRYNNESDNYFVYYDHECDSTSRDDECVTCAWNEYGYKNYYKRCSVRNRCVGQYEYYARWHANNYTAVMAAGDADGGVRLECPEAEILSVDPMTAPWLGGTTVRFTVVNHRVMAEGKEVSVTVAGRECTEPKMWPMQDDKRVTGISCTMMPAAVTDRRRNHEGPVRVQYTGDQPKVTVTSALVVGLVDPVIADMSPRCGPATGGTMLRIAGRYLDAGTTLRVSVGDYANCEPVALYPDLLLCVTGPAVVAGPTAARINVVFDGQLSKYVGDGSVVFTYAAVPALDAGQSLQGIASGGTAVQLRGRHFSCLRYAMLYVHHGERLHYTSCRLVNDTLAVCRAPKLPYGHVDSAASLKYGLRVQDPEYHEMDLSPPRDPHGYSLHPDPVLVDFVTDGRTVTINGRDLDRGYRWQDDLTVRFRGSGGGCDVTFTDHRRIVCVPSNPSAADLDAVPGVIVTIGDTFAYVVKRKADGRNRGRNSGPPENVVTGVKIVCLIAIAIACIAVYRTKAKHRAGATAAAAAAAACNNSNTTITTDHTSVASSVGYRIN